MVTDIDSGEIINCASASVYLTVLIENRNKAELALYSVNYRKFRMEPLMFYMAGYSF